MARIKAQIPLTRHGQLALREPPHFTGAQARVIRLACGLTQAGMGDHMGVGERTVRAWELAGETFHFQNKLEREKLEVMQEEGERLTAERWRQRR